MIDIPEPYRFENMLNGKTVVVGTGASISIYRVPDLVRDLRREGANVIVIMTANAQELINPEVMRWASENQVITKITQQNATGQEKITIEELRTIEANTAIIWGGT